MKTAYRYLDLAKGDYWNAYRSKNSGETFAALVKEASLARTAVEMQHARDQVQWAASCRTISREQEAEFLSSHPLPNL